MSPTARLAQRAAALDRGNAIRIGRAELRRKVKAGEVSIYDVIKEMPECVQGVPIVMLLCWPRGMGKKKAYMYLKTVPGLWDMTVPVGRLGPVRIDHIVTRMQSGVTGAGPIV